MSVPESIEQTPLLCTDPLTRSTISISQLGLNCISWAILYITIVSWVFSTLPLSHGHIHTTTTHCVALRFSL
ncbi:hypothetical protein BD777DRAFT_121139 [Yarrowia lipolytica]|nr:hypothetical protein BD777DRAFT_121139 [Yarrowia lipolytica]